MLKIKEQLAQLNGDVMIVSADDFPLAYQSASYLLEVADERDWGNSVVEKCMKREHDTLIVVSYIALL